MSQNVLQVRNLETFYGPVMAIRGVSLDVEEGKIVAVLGSNGAGKTTVLKTISGAMEPQKGTISFHGEDIAGMEPDRVANKGIGHVPEGREVFPFLSVQENLEMGAFGRRDKDAIEQDLETVFDYFPILRERAKNEAAYLSGGQQQMLAIGRALMTNPKLLILDEATEGLAPIIRSQIWDCLQRLKQDGQSILIIDKNLDAIARLADHHYILDKGRVVWHGDSKLLLATTDLKSRYLGV